VFLFVVTSLYPTNTYTYESFNTCTLTTIFNLARKGLNLCKMKKIIITAIILVALCFFYLTVEKMPAVDQKIIVGFTREDCWGLLIGFSISIFGGAFLLIEEFLHPQKV
jgi:hypothetical protein